MASTTTDGRWDLCWDCDLWTRNLQCGCWQVTCGIGNGTSSGTPDLDLIATRPCANHGTP